jgi:hypothetical protein
MSGTTPEQVHTVLLQVWRVPARDVPAALVAGRVLVHRLRRRSDVTFAKFLGTASAAFLPTAVTPTRWAVLSCWRGAAPDPQLTSWWHRHADEGASLTLRPLSTRGSWDRQEPFTVAPSSRTPSPHRWTGPVVVLTRSSLRMRRARSFYRAIPAVAADLRAAQGCRTAFGIGEAPLVRQGTVSVWDSADAMTEFAYGSDAHRAAVTATPTSGWYAEELFTRFALVDSSGTIDGTGL